MKPAYYNEINPLPDQTLSNLIAARHIAPGDVDEKSIEDAHGNACSHSPCRRAASMVFCEGMFTQASQHGLVQLLPDTSGIPVAQAPPASHAAAILKACLPDERPMLQFWFETSLCPGELQALQWSYIDWERAIAWIELNQVAGVIKGPKTAAGIRDVELSAEALSALRAQRPISELKGERAMEHRRPDPQDALAAGLQARRSGVPQPVPSPPHLCLGPADGWRQSLVRDQPTGA